MAHPKVADLEALLLALQDGGVDYVLVGGAAAVIHGAPITTQDIDIVPEQSASNLARLQAVLESLEARFRPVLPNRDLPPTAEHLSGTGRLNLTTTRGPLDILLRLHDGRGYDDLVAHSSTVTDDGLEVRVIDLDLLIEIKRNTGRAKDQLVLPVLIALRDRN